MNLRWRNPQRRHLVRLEPDAHGERPLAKNVGALNAADGAQFRLHHARQIIRDLILIKLVR